jgi:hypothetical protein
MTLILVNGICIKFDLKNKCLRIQSSVSSTIELQKFNVLGTTTRPHSTQNV